MRSDPRLAWGWGMCLVGGAMKVTCFGHSCFLVESAGTRFLFDPFIRPNSLAAHVEVEKIQADVILISHAHMDHVSDAVELATRTNWVKGVWH